MKEPAKITVDSLFDNDDLKSNPASGFQFAPDGSCITFLQPETRDASKLSIWRFDLNTHQLNEWISAPIKPQENRSSTEFEQNDRERVPSTRRLTPLDVVKAQVEHLPLLGLLLTYTPRKIDVVEGAGPLAAIFL